MDRVSGFLFSPWLSKEETEAVNAHQLKNFTYINYSDSQKSTKKLFGRYNKVTKEVMWADHAPLIGFKCAWILTLALPIEFAMRETFYIAKMTGLIFETLICKKRAVDFPSNVWKIVSNIARVFFYLTGIAFACVGGILFDPLKARKRIGLMVLKLNQGVTLSEYREMERDVKAKKPGVLIQYFQSFYLAPCMQPWVNNIDADRRWNIILRSDDYEEASVNKKVKECPCPRWFIFPVLPGCVS